MIGAKKKSKKIRSFAEREKMVKAAEQAVEALFEKYKIQIEHQLFLIGLITKYGEDVFNSPLQQVENVCEAFNKGLTIDVERNW